MDITLHLHDIEDLFETPDVTPLDPRWRIASGMETIYAEYVQDRRAAPGKLTIYLPAAQITPDLPGQVQTGIQRYCDVESKRCKISIAIIQRVGRRNLVLGLILLSCLLTGSAIVSNVSSLPGWLSSLVSESLIIAGWVVVWHPVEQLLYEWRPDKLRLSFLDWLRAMDTEIRPEPAEVESSNGDSTVRSTN